MTAPGSNPVPFRSDEREFDSICNCFLFLFFFLFSCTWDQGFLVGLHRQYSLMLHLVGGSRGLIGIIPGWDQVRVGSGAGGITFGSLLLSICPRFTIGKFPRNFSGLPSGELN